MKEQKVILSRPIDLPEILAAPERSYVDPSSPAQMAAQYEWEKQLAAKGVKLLTPQFPDLFQEMTIP